MSGAGVVTILAIPLIVMPTLVVFGGRRLRRQGYDRTRQPPPPAEPHEFGDDAVEFVGGWRVCGANATIPLVRLRADRHWVSIAMRGAVTAFGPDGVWIDRQRVVAVRRIDVLLGPGVRFDTPDGAYDGVIFWSDDRVTLAHRLHDLGWPVVWQPAPPVDT